MIGETQGEEFKELLLRGNNVLYLRKKIWSISIIFQLYYP